MYGKTGRSAATQVPTKTAKKEKQKDLIKFPRALFIERVLLMNVMDERKVIGGVTLPLHSAILDF